MDVSRIFHIKETKLSMKFSWKDTHGSMEGYTEQEIDDYFPVYVRTEKDI
jgi:hypothetical protein